MKLDSTTKARIAVLNGEIDSVHSDNRFYWEDKAPSHEANIEYQHRQCRLKRITNELAALRLEGEMQANSLPKPQHRHSNKRHIEVQIDT
jgi:hypothetical protein